MNPQEKTLMQIAAQFSGILVSDLTTLEKKVANILIEKKYLRKQTWKGLPFSDKNDEMLFCV